MPKFVVRGADKPEEIVEFWLESGADSVWLRARRMREGSEARSLAVVRPDGTLCRINLATGIPGLQYDDKGRIKEVE